MLIGKMAANLAVYTKCVSSFGVTNTWAGVAPGS